MWPDLCGVAWKQIPETSRCLGTSRSVETWRESRPLRKQERISEVLADFITYYRIGETPISTGNGNVHQRRREIRRPSLHLILQLILDLAHGSGGGGGNRKKGVSLPCEDGFEGQRAEDAGTARTAGLVVALGGRG